MNYQIQKIQKLVVPHKCQVPTNKSSGSYCPSSINLKMDIIEKSKWHENITVEDTMVNRKLYYGANVSVMPLHVFKTVNKNQGLVPTPINNSLEI